MESLRRVSSGGNTLGGSHSLGGGAGGAHTGYPPDTLSSEAGLAAQSAATAAQLMNDSDPANLRLLEVLASVEAGLR